MELKNIAASLAKFHQLVPDIPRDAANPFFKSKYAPLETILSAIKDPLKQAGLVFSQVPVGSNKLKTIIIDVASGEFLEGEYEMTPTKNDPQGQGSAITYMRRYALVAMLGLNTDEDDDASAASEVAKKIAPQVAPPAVTKPASGKVSAASTPYATPHIKAPAINSQPHV